MSKSKGSKKADEYHKLKIMIDDLKVMQRELDPESVNNPAKKSNNAFDHMLTDNKIKVERITEISNILLGKNKPEGVIAIKLKAEMRELFTDCKQNLQKMSEDAGKKKNKKNKDMMIETIRLHKQELEYLESKASNKSFDTIIIDKSRNQRRIAQQKRRSIRSPNTIDSANIVTAEEPSAEVQLFERKVDENRQKQDVVLTKINDGLTELKEIATDIKVNLAKQDEMVDQVGIKMDDQIKVFRSGNKKLKDLLEKTGGSSKWCCVIFMLIMLLTIGGIILSQK